jgi:hypothetical protein
MDKTFEKTYKIWLQGFELWNLKEERLIATIFVENKEEAKELAEMIGAVLEPIFDRFLR